MCTQCTCTKFSTVPHTKLQYLQSITIFLRLILLDKRSRALEVTLGSSADTNLGHIHNGTSTVLARVPWYFGIAFSREVVKLLGYSIYYGT